MTFAINEHCLTNAIFNNSALDARGPGTKEQARHQARTMLLADELTMCLSALGIMPDGWCFCPSNRDPNKPDLEHVGECQDARRLLGYCTT